jgi:hypothetical protein
MVSSNLFIFLEFLTHIPISFGEIRFCKHKFSIKEPHEALREWRSTPTASVYADGQIGVVGVGHGPGSLRNWPSA